MKDRKISLPHPSQPPSLTPTATSPVVIYHNASECATCTLISPLAVGTIQASTTLLFSHL